jgi:ferredoxin, 2Fe-2S
MPAIAFLQGDLTRTVVEAPVGITVMEAAKTHGVNGIEALCHGALCCATCHVYVDPLWFGKLPQAKPDEMQMLELTAAPQRPTSRLSCQITVTEELDGLVVATPEEQV